MDDESEWPGHEIAEERYRWLDEIERAVEAEGLAMAQHLLAAVLPAGEAPAEGGASMAFGTAMEDWEGWEAVAGYVCAWSPGCSALAERLIHGSVALPWLEGGEAANKGERTSRAWGRRRPEGTMEASASLVKSPGPGERTPLVVLRVSRSFASAGEARACASAARAAIGGLFLHLPKPTEAVYELLKAVGL
jgi:hypothetical protein